MLVAGVGVGGGAGGGRLAGGEVWGAWREFVRRWRGVGSMVMVAG